VFGPVAARLASSLDFLAVKVAAPALDTSPRGPALVRFFIVTRID
jgi:hypothetical protein